jgi:HlyD family secretion protein
VLLVKAGVKADVELDAVPDATYPAHVTAVDLTPTQSTRGGVAYLVRFALGPGTTAAGAKAPPPRPGMSAVARLHVRTSRDVLAVPAAAVFRDGGDQAVWKVVDGKAVRTVVRLGAQGQRTVAITSGLALGDVIVIRGADRVRAGATLPSPPAEPSASPS